MRLAENTAEMFYLPLFGLVGCAAFATYLVRTLRTPSHSTDSADRPPHDDPLDDAKSRALRTTLDVSTADDALRLVRRMSAPGLSTEALADRLTACYRRFPPDMRSMQRISIAQQRLEGSGGELEFATSTVYAAMMASCTETDAVGDGAADGGQDGAADGTTDGTTDGAESGEPGAEARAGEQD